MLVSGYVGVEICLVNLTIWFEVFGSRESGILVDF